LAEAMRTMGVATKKDAVNKALHEWNQRVRRLAALESLAARGRAENSTLPSPPMTPRKPPGRDRVLSESTPSPWWHLFEEP